MHRKDDIVTSEGPGPGYAQKITRTALTGGDAEEVTYFDAKGKEIDPHTLPGANPAPLAHHLNPVIAGKP